MIIQDHRASYWGPKAAENMMNDIALSAGYQNNVPAVIFTVCSLFTGLCPAFLRWFKPSEEASKRSCSGALWLNAVASPGHGKTALLNILAEALETLQEERISSGVDKEEEPQSTSSRRPVSPSSDPEPLVPPKVEILSDMTASAIVKSLKEKELRDGTLIVLNDEAETALTKLKQSGVAGLHRLAQLYSSQAVYSKTYGGKEDNLTKVPSSQVIFSITFGMQPDNFSRHINDLGEVGSGFWGRPLHVNAEPSDSTPAPPGALSKACNVFSKNMSLFEQWSNMTSSPYAAKPEDDEREGNEESDEQEEEEDVSNNEDDDDDDGSNEGNEESDEQEVGNDDDGDDDGDDDDDNDDDGSDDDNSDGDGDDDGNDGSVDDSQEVARATKKERRPKRVRKEEEEAHRMHLHRKVLTANSSAALCLELGKR